MSTATMQEEPKTPYQWKKLVVWGSEDLDAYFASRPKKTPEELANNEAYQHAINAPVLSDEEMAEWEDAIAYARNAWRAS